VSKIFKLLIIINLFFNPSFAFSSSDVFSVVEGSYVCKVKTSSYATEAKKEFNLRFEKSGGHVILNIIRLKETEIKMEKRRAWRSGCGIKYNCLGNASSGPFEISYEMYGTYTYEGMTIPKKKKLKTTFIDQEYNRVTFPSAEDPDISVDFFYYTGKDLQFYKKEDKFPNHSLGFLKGGFGIPDYKGTSISSFACQKLII
jgi:hypothetical protein